ncbi:MAG TPA: hypothetical protein VFX16_16650 [Pseudonocardiaceae bacterium]|nr:hypothetical protein [Pseudonocardiaceae bacterium]
MIEDLGFDAVDGGSIEDSWRQQPGTPVYGKDHGIQDTLRALAEATQERPAEFRAER